MSESRRWLLAAAGVMLAAASLYVVTGPGRIDIIDAQLRYDVGINVLVQRRPVLADPMLQHAAVRGPDGASFSRYGLASVLTSAPLLALGLAADRPAGAVSHFLFSLTTALFGAATLGLLLAFLCLLGVPLRRAVAWSTVLALGTLWWPLSVSTFDQVQQGFFLLLSLYGAYRGGREGSSAWLVSGGLAGGLLINFAESYALLLPAVGLAALTPAHDGDQVGPRAQRYVLFGMACAVGLAAWMAFNDARFDDPLYTGRGGSGAGLRGGALDIPTFDNPLEGAVSLLVSPGKGILFFAPPVLLALWGARPLWRRAPWLGGAVLATAALHFGMISSLSFFGGDWAWGPRYLVVLLPLAALAWACIPGEPLRRAPVRALIGAGVAVQLLAIGVDHQRYFFERSLPPFFWLEDWSYFRGSALLARPAELVDVLDGDEGLPGRRPAHSAVLFSFPVPPSPARESYVGEASL